MRLKNVDYQSIRDYIAHEEASEQKHEYEKGDILMLTGGTIDHGLLCGNAYHELRRKMETDGSECRVIGSEVRIHIEQADSIVYPDAMVICADIEVSDKDEQAVTNPVLIVEVLSKSTESYDRGDKFYKYRQLPSLKEYVLIDQEKPVVETFFKRDNNVWEISRFTGLQDLITIKSLGIEIHMDELYINISWNS